MPRSKLFTLRGYYPSGVAKWSPADLTGTHWWDPEVGVETEAAMQFVQASSQHLVSGTTLPDSLKGTSGGGFSAACVFRPDVTPGSSRPFVNLKDGGNRGWNINYRAGDSKTQMSYQYTGGSAAGVVNRVIGAGNWGFCAGAWDHGANTYDLKTYRDFDTTQASALGLASSGAPLPSSDGESMWVGANRNAVLHIDVTVALLVIWDEAISAADMDWLWNTGSYRTKDEILARSWANGAAVKHLFMFNQLTGSVDDYVGGVTLSRVNSPALVDGYIPAVEPLDRSPVSKWTDRNLGMSVLQPTLAYRPLWYSNVSASGYPGIMGDGVDDFLLASPGPGIAHPGDMAVLAQFGEVTNPLFGTNDGNTWVNSAAGNYQVKWTTTLATTGIAADTARHAFVYRLDTVNTKIRVDGVEYASGNAGATSTLDLVFFARTNGTANWTISPLSHFLTRPTAKWTADELAALEAWMIART